MPKTDLLSTADIERLTSAIQNVNEFRKEGSKYSVEVSLSCGTAKVYHMASKEAPTINPIVRIDIKMKDMQPISD